MVFALNHLHLRLCSSMGWRVQGKQTPNDKCGPDVICMQWPLEFAPEIACRRCLMHKLKCEVLVFGHSCTTCVKGGSFCTRQLTVKRLDELATTDIVDIVRSMRSIYARLLPRRREEAMQGMACTVYGDYYHALTTLVAVHSSSVAEDRTMSDPLNNCGKSLKPHITIFGYSFVASAIGVGPGERRRSFALHGPAGKA